MTDVTIASGELIPCLSHQFFNDHQEIAETVRDYMQSPCVDSIMWDVARECFRGNQNIAGIVQEYHLGVSMAYLNIAENVQSRASAELLRCLSEQISAVDGQATGRRPEGIVAVRKACLLVASNVALFSRNNIFHATPVTEVARLTLAGMNLLHPLNGEDPILQEEIPDEDVLITPTGHKFSLSSLLQFHNTRPYRGREGEHHGQKFIVNPVTNTFFPWCDVLALVIAAVRSGRALDELHQRAVVPPGAPGVYPFASLHDFYLWMQAHPGIREDSIYMEVNGLIQRKHQDDNLQRMWSSVHLAIMMGNPRPEGVPGVNAQALEIRTWMHADANQPLLRRVPGLCLRDLQMTDVPKELHLLTGVQRIDFSNNQLTSISEDLFHGLTALKELLFYDNQLASLPEGLFYWKPPLFVH